MSEQIGIKRCMQKCTKYECNRMVCGLQQPKVQVGRVAFSTFCSQIETEKNDAIKTCDTENEARYQKSYWNACLVRGIFHLMSDRSRPDVSMVTIGTCGLSIQWEYACMFVFCVAFLRLPTLLSLSV